MAGGGRVGQPGSGRKKGTPDKHPRMQGKVPYVPALDKGEMPLAYMLRVMRDETADPERRDFMASKAAPYCHRQLKALDVTGHVTHGISKELQDFIAGNAGAARSFLGFDGEDPKPEGSADIGSVSDS